MDKETGPREYTTEEVRDKFLKQVWSYIDYWETLEGKTTRERLSGLAFSMLVVLDGGSGLPGFIVAPNPHESDKEYHQEEGSNWFPENHDKEINSDIGGSLHEFLHQFDPHRQSNEDNSELDGDDDEEDDDEEPYESEGEIIACINGGSIIVMYVQTDDGRQHQISWEGRYFQNFIDNHDLTDYDQAVGIRVKVLEDQDGNKTIADI